MLRYNFFPTQIQNTNQSYQSEVLNVIGEYISRINKHKILKATGINTAKALQAIIKVSGLDGTDLMKKILEVIKMRRGEGPLANSIDLRSDLFEHLFGLMNVTETEIQAVQAELYPDREFFIVHTSRIDKDKFFVNDNSPRVRAMLAVVEFKLAERTRAAELRM